MGAHRRTPEFRQRFTGAQCRTWRQDSVCIRTSNGTTKRSIIHPSRGRCGPPGRATVSFSTAVSLSPLEQRRHRTSRIAHDRHFGAAHRLTVTLRSDGSAVSNRRRAPQQGGRLEKRPSFGRAAPRSNANREMRPAAEADWRLRERSAIPPSCAWRQNHRARGPHQFSSSLRAPLP